MKKFVIYNKSTNSIEHEFFNEKEVKEAWSKLSNPKAYTLYEITPNYKTHETVKRSLCVIIDVNSKGQSTCTISPA